MTVRKVTIEGTVTGSAVGALYDRATKQVKQALVDVKVINFEPLLLGNVEPAEYTTFYTQDDEVTAWTAYYEQKVLVETNE